MSTTVKYAYKPGISGNKIAYKNTKGKSITAQFYDNTHSLANALRETVSGKKPNITKGELQKALWNQFNNIAYSGRGDNCDMTIMSRAEKLIDHFAQKDSEGEGQDIITQKEQFKMMEYWHRWFGYNTSDNKPSYEKDSFDYWQYNSKDANGKTTSISFSEEMSHIMKALEQLKNKNSGITKFELKEAVWNNTSNIYGNRADSDNNVALSFEKAEKLIDYYAETISENEAKGIITAKEQKEIINLWTSWYGQKK